MPGIWGELHQQHGCPDDGARQPCRRCRLMSGASVGVLRHLLVEGVEGGGHWQAAGGRGFHLLTVELLLLPAVAVAVVAVAVPFYPLLDSFQASSCCAQQECAARKTLCSRVAEARVACVMIWIRIAWLQGDVLRAGHRRALLQHRLQGRRGVSSAESRGPERTWSCQILRSILVRANLLQLLQRHRPAV
jgi:hypothetical protein